MWRFLCWVGTNAKVDVSWGLIAKVKLLEDGESCTGYKLDDKRSLKSMYSRLRILVLSFCVRDGKLGSVKVVGGEVNGRGSVTGGSSAGPVMAGFSDRGLGPIEERPSWFPSRSSSCCSWCKLAGERRGMFTLELPRTRPRCSEPTASAMSWHSWLSCPLKNGLSTA